VEVNLTAADGYRLGATLFAELGEKSIGHFGFFRERFRASLWRETVDWLERQ
jgi:predicted alpha/beta hydrolase